MGVWNILLFFIFFSVIMYFWDFFWIFFGVWILSCELLHYFGFFIYFTNNLELLIDFI